MGGVLKDHILPAAVILIGFLAIFRLNDAVASSRPPMPDGFEDTDLTVHAGYLKGYAFGAEGLIADYYFMRSLQYVGDKLLKDKSENINIDDLRRLNPRLLYPMLDTATDLDPHFIAAYSYGAVVLPAVDQTKAIALAQKGITNNPDHWRLYQHLAYIYWRLGDYEKAAGTYERGSQVPGSSPFMRLMAASMKTQGGSRETARAIFTEMLTSSDDEQVQITAKRRLAELDSIDEREAIDSSLAKSKAATGHCPASFAEIVADLSSIKLPAGNEFEVNARGQLVDPTGAPYLLDRVNCRAAIDTQNSGLPANFR